MNPISPTNRVAQFAFGSAVAIAILLPRILHVDNDHQAAVTDVLGPTAHVACADPLKVSRRELVATDPIYLAVLDISLGSETGLDLPPILHDRDAISVIVFSSNVESQAFDEQIKATLAKSSTSLETHSATMRDRLVLPPATPSEEIA